MSVKSHNYQWRAVRHFWKTSPDSNRDPRHQNISKVEPQKIWASQLEKVRSLPRFHSTICAEWSEWPLVFVSSVLANFPKPDRKDANTPCMIISDQVAFLYGQNTFFHSIVKGDWLLQMSMFCLFKRSVCNPREQIGLFCYQNRVSLWTVLSDHPFPNVKPFPTQTKL